MPRNDLIAFRYGTAAQGASQQAAQPTITGVTVANPAVVTTSSAHGLSTGNEVSITGVVGATAVNGSWIVTVLSTTTFSIPVNNTATYVSGGTFPLLAPQEVAFETDSGALRIGDGVTAYAALPNSAAYWPQSANDARYQAISTVTRTSLAVYNVLSTDQTVEFTATSTAQIANLPSSPATAQKITFTNPNSNSSIASVVAASGQTIAGAGGAATVQIPANGGLTLQWDATVSSWRYISGSPATLGGSGLRILGAQINSLVPVNTPVVTATPASVTTGTPPTMTFSSIPGAIAVGQIVTGAGISGTTTVTAISGNTVTLASGTPTVSAYVFGAASALTSKASNVFEDGAGNMSAATSVTAPLVYGPVLEANQAGALYIAGRYDNGPTGNGNSYTAGTTPTAPHYGRVDTSCSTTNGSAVIGDTGALASDIGRYVVGAGIPAGAYIVSFAGGGTGVGYTISAPATATATGVSLSIGPNFNAGARVTDFATPGEWYTPGGGVAPTDWVNYLALITGAAGAVSSGTAPTVTPGPGGGGAGATVSVTGNSVGGTITVTSPASRTDTCNTTSGSSTITDTSITANDFGRSVSGTGIPTNSYVGTVTAGTSFVLSSSATTSTAVNATASGTGVSLTVGGTLPAATICTVAYHTALSAAPVAVIISAGNSTVAVSKLYTNGSGSASQFTVGAGSATTGVTTAQALQFSYYVQR